jgi:LysR family transcriptional regulator, glycine cleavage system transcriptional activator
MADWMPSLNALRAFEALARHLSYRAAAAELKVTPAAVKQLVGKLEESVGRDLVRRAGRGIAVTGAGAGALGDLHGGFRQIASAVKRLRQHDSHQPLAITVEPSFATGWLIPRLEGFKRRHPEVDVLINASLRIVDLEREAVDIGIRYAVKPHAGQIAHRLFDDETLAVCSPARAAGPPGLHALADLEKAPLIHLELGDAGWRTSAGHWFDWSAWFRAVGAGELKSRRGMRFNDYNLAIQAAIAGQGVVLGSWPIVRDLIQSGLLVSPFAERARTDVGYDLVTTKGAMAKPEVAAFVAWILEARRAAAPMLVSAP